ncbi:RrF2 family transcriptional regulator [Tichowtungia aerotolerans]|uniref:Rrf2 family transcriptional regulator n=1 Tax=Tichowtungia aerotolerans TaxID=2697043 RepID=A0A6P1MDH9_9BACT|nr:Rrf2 family transcriptional regulator [Tichowtungia aerotolerans]QHI69646.1 Rrf2 family transcriptional regulator [Tichowtungia aerotolerans]
MKLTTKSEYALLIMIFLARTEADQFARLEDICATYDLSQKYAEQLTSTLKKSGLVAARRGVAGGYQLARPAAEISMAEIVRLMDGALAPIGAISEYFPCRSLLEKETGVMNVMQDIRDYTANIMEGKTLADLA